MYQLYRSTQKVTVCCLVRSLLYIVRCVQLHSLISINSTNVEDIPDHIYQQDGTHHTYTTTLIRIWINFPVVNGLGVEADGMTPEITRSQPMNFGLL
jgi:hypothetical protein